ncbi:SpaH/EbpB family LPXTG-anchored major pilin, partial [Arcanobacterium canis]
PPGSSTRLGEGNIDLKHKASITIHKMLNPETTHEATGVVDNGAKGQKLSGVKFKITKLKLALDNQENLKTAATLTPETAAGLKSAEPGDTFTEQTRDGVIEKQLPVGVYLVEELQLTEDDNPNVAGVKVDPTTITPAPPFIVRLPMTNPTGDGWNYDVHVYPKNTSDKVEKKVVDAGKNGQDTITYTIEVTVPQVSAKHERTKFEIIDDYDQDKLDPKSVKVKSVTMGDTTFTPGVDFTEVNNNDTLTLSFEKGFSKLANNQVVTVTLDAKIVKAGKIVNEATRISNDTRVNKDERKKTNKVETYLGAVKVIKTGIKDKKLSGAKFGVYRCTGSDSNWQLEGKLIDTLITGEDGVAISKPLHVNDFEDGIGDVQDPLNKNYCLKELAAPAGYLLSDSITHFTITKQSVADSRDPNVVTYTANIKNVPSDTPDLPLTGGQGIALLVILGAGVAGAAVYSARRNSTKA